jgi:hypothetical protein
MRIALRTGAGRGVYELAGIQGEHSASDLFDKEMFYELTPSLVVPGYAVPSSRHGKPRINLDDDHRQFATHLYRLLAALLLLPQPRRELRKTEGDILVAYGAYSMTAIKIDVVAIEAFRTIVRPTDILLENFAGIRESLNFINRMSRIMRLWRTADTHDSRIARLLRQHKTALQTPKISHKDVERAAKDIFVYLNTTYDPLQKIESMLGINQSLDTEEFIPAIGASEFGINDSVSPEVARNQAVKKWRKVAARDAEAQKFSDDVKTYYRDTCLFTGQKLPKLKAIGSAGVDAAHILPWASHGINSVSNGICLSKQSHWAFDSGVIKFSFDESANQYVISIPKAVDIEARQMGFSLDVYQAMIGPIPRDRFPDDTYLWPNPKYIDAYNSIMFT